MINTQLLDEYIDKSGKKKRYLADKLGITIQTFRKKCTNAADFTIEEANVLCDELSIVGATNKEKIFFYK